MPSRGAAGSFAAGVRNSASGTQFGSESVGSRRIGLCQRRRADVTARREPLAVGDCSRLDAL